MTDTGREAVPGWWLAKERRAGLAFGHDVEGVSRVSADSAEHRIGFTFSTRADEGQTRLGAGLEWPTNGERDADALRWDVRDR